MHNVARYGLKSCIEKVRGETRLREEGERGAALKEWEKTGYC